MVFSLGQDFYGNLLNFSTENTDNDQDAIKQNFKLQLRLSDFFRNNQFQTLYNSQLYSGEKTYLDQPAALGGPINPNVGGATNIPGLGIFADEFPFWQMNLDKRTPTNPNIMKTDLSKDNLPKLLPNESNVQEQPQLLEKFTNFDRKEYFNDGKTWALWGIVIGFISIILIFCFIKFVYHRKNPTFSSN